jgi:outer membrane receptor protein involved in Fe transport
MGRLAAAATLAVAGGEARGDGHGDLSGLSLEELMAVPVTAATAAPQTVAEAPSTVHVFTADTIRRRGYRSLGDLLDDVPELQLHLRAAPDFGHMIGVRGVVGNGNEKIIILRDGVRIDAVGASPIAVGRNFTLAGADRVEVVLGPVSSLYGPDAFTAVVNVVTVGGADPGGAVVSVGVGRFRTAEGSLVAGTEVHGVGVAITIAGYHSDEPDLSRHYPGDFAWYRDRYLTGGEVLAFPGAAPDQVVSVPIEPWSTPTEDRFVALRIDTGGVRLGHVRHRHRHGSTAPIRPDIGLYVDDARWEYAITTTWAEHVHHARGGRLELTSGLSVHTYQVAPDTAFVNVFSGYRPGYKYEDYLRTRVEERLSYRFSDRLTATIGVGFRDLAGTPKTGDLERPFDPETPGELQGHVYPGSDVTDVAGRDLSVPQRFFAVREREAGTYLELVARPHRRVAITAAERLDWNSRYGWSSSPRLGATLHRGSTRLKLIYGRAFLAPSPNQVFQHHGSFVPVTNQGGQVVGLESFFFRLPNPDLAPERIHMGELIVFHDLGETIRLSGDAYVAQVRDRFGTALFTGETYGGWPVDAVLRPVNLDDSLVTWGGTLGVNARVDRGDWSLAPTAAYSLTGGRRGDDPLPATSAHVVKAIVDGGWRDLSASARLTYRSAARHPELRDGAGELVSIDGAAVVDLHLRWQDVLPDPRLRTALWLDAQNLLDARYRLPSNAFDHLAGVPQDPLRLTIGIDLQY